ncbi:MAG: hypothetical protein WEB00_13765 [Dehalococcoidia bacterium]
MAASFTPTRVYGLHGDLPYYTETELDPEDGFVQTRVDVMVPDEEVLTAGWFWWDDNELVAQKLPPAASEDEQLEKVGSDAGYVLASDENHAVTFLLAGWVSD